MDNATSNKNLYRWIGAAIVIVAAIAVIAGSKKGAEISKDALSATTTSVGSSTGEVSAAAPTLAYSVFIATSTYRKDEVIPIIVSVLNLTGASTTLSFKNGCQVDYTIGNFDLLSRMRCRPDPTSFVVPPREIRQVKVAHYPSVYKLEPGSYVLRAAFIGYGGMSVPITITK